jgi:hypothetical protein
MTRIRRSITHWTGGGGRASPLDKKHYHRITEFDGTIVDGNEEIADNIVTSDGDYAAHTLNLNTASAGFAMAGMLDAKEIPFDPGPSPITEKQFEAHCRMLAEFHTANGIPVTRETCLTHAEVEPTLGVKQQGKWDLTRLPFKPDIRGALPVGDYMRERVLSYGSIKPPEVTNRPVLRQGTKGAFVLDLQMLLATLGFFPGRKDGEFGPLTKEAVVAFQSAHDLKADGVVGPVTWDRLMKAEPKPMRAVNLQDLREAGSRTVQQADLIQKVLVGAGGLTGLATVMEEITTKGPETLAQADTLFTLATTLLDEHWPLLILLGAAGAVWAAVRKIKAARLDDAKTGANLRR